jgi:hypothetical protein
MGANRLEGVSQIHYSRFYCRIIKSLSLYYGNSQIMDANSEYTLESKVVLIVAKHF